MGAGNQPESLLWPNATLIWNKRKAGVFSKQRVSYEGR
jgi:hypothetical protein